MITVKSMLLRAILVASLIFIPISLSAQMVNPYPRTGTESDHSLLVDKHEPAISALYSATSSTGVFSANTTSFNVISANVLTANTASFGAISRVTSTVVVTNLNAAKVNGYTIKSYESPEQTITAAGALTLAHGLGTTPKIIQAYLVCKTAEKGYSMGDETPCTISAESLAASDSYGVAITYDTTNIYVRFGSIANVFTINDKTTGSGSAIAIANWKVIFRAWAFQ